MLRNIRQQLDRSPFFIKLLNREYWSMWATYPPAILYYLYASLREGTFFWFSAANPSIETGGMLGESKIAILDRIPSAYKPRTQFFKANTPFEEVAEILRLEGFIYPLIAKPDVGERGLLVTKIENQQELADYWRRYGALDLLVQAYVAHKVELAILYCLSPNMPKAQVLSVAGKRFLSVTGDGVRSLESLILAQPRAVLQLEKLRRTHGTRFAEILPLGAVLELEPIGNHSRGTMFLNENHLLKDPAFCDRVHQLALQIEGVYFGRFDLRCRSVEDFKKGQHIAIVELNGVGSEPAHIYDPHCSLWQAYCAIWQQWRVMHCVSRYNHHRRHIPYMSWAFAKAHWQKTKTYKQLISSFL